MQYTPKYEIAQEYFPNLTAESALKALNKEIRSTPGLLAAMTAAGYTTYKKQFSPKQIEIIMQFLGEP